MVANWRDVFSEILRDFGMSLFPTGRSDRVTIFVYGFGWGCWDFEAGGTAFCGKSRMLNIVGQLIAARREGPRIVAWLESLRF